MKDATGFDMAYSINLVSFILWLPMEQIYTCIYPLNMLSTNMCMHVLLLIVAYVLQEEKTKKKVTSDKKVQSNRGPRKTISVPADRLIIVDSDKSAKESDAAEKAPDGGMMTRSSAAGKGGHSSVDRSSPSATRKVKGTSKGVSPAEPDTLPAGKSRFNEGDRVMMHSVQGFPVHGTVRWIGTLPISKESKIKGPVTFAGIETVSTVLEFNSLLTVLMVSLPFL